MVNKIVYLIKRHVLQTVFSGTSRKLLECDKKLYEDFQKKKDDKENRR